MTPFLIYDTNNIVSLVDYNVVTFIVWVYKEEYLLYRISFLDLLRVPRRNQSAIHSINIYWVGGHNLTVPCHGKIWLDSDVCASNKE